MIVYRCDKCGKDVSSKGGLRVIYLKPSIDQNKSVEVCEGCWEEWKGVEHAQYKIWFEMEGK
jgi:DNA-directed RNA polymerase subunit RPC12/RpoP